MTVDLTKMTQMELQDLVREANSELDNYKNRGKTKCFRIFIPFEGAEYFIHKENAIAHIQKLIEWDEIFPDELNIEIGLIPFDNAEIEKYCKDFKKE